MVSIHMKTAMVSLQAVMVCFQVKAILAIIKAEMAMPKLLTTLQQHADKIIEINQTTIILVRILIMSMGVQRQTNKEIPTLLSVDARSQNLDFRYSLGRETGSPSFCNLSCWQTDTIGPWTGREEIIFCLKDEALSFVSQLSVEVRNE